MPIWISTNNFIHKRLFLIKIYFFILKKPTCILDLSHYIWRKKTIYGHQKIIDLEEQKGEIEQEMMKNEATLAQEKQKAVSVALWEQKLTTFLMLHSNVRFNL